MFPSSTCLVYHIRPLPILLLYISTPPPPLSLAISPTLLPPLTPSCILLHPPTLPRAVLPPALALALAPALAPAPAANIARRYKNINARTGGGEMG